MNLDVGSNVKTLFKYRKLETGSDVVRTLDILRNNRLFFPLVNSLNDPFEGCSVIVDGSWAGCSMRPQLGLLQQPMEDALNKIRVLSLTASPLCPQMWAHCAADYSGVCIGITRSGLPNTVAAMEYTDELEHCDCRAERIPDPISATLNAAKRALFKKQTGWAYEDEWRYIATKEEHPSNYIQLGEESICSVILGHRVSSEIAAEIVFVCKEFGIVRVNLIGETFKNLR